MSVVFSDVKARVTIEQVATQLQLQTKEDKNGQLRAKCPACESTDERSLVITPDVSLFYCFASRKGGDQIALFSHIKGCSMREAAIAIDKPLVNSDKPTVNEVKKGFDSSKYLAELKPVEGLPDELCQKVGIGKATKGTHAGKTVVALRDSTGAIIVFASVTDLKLPSKW